jgi:uncharacterized protein YajQ (UPF0234 family)
MEMDELLKMKKRIDDYENLSTMIGECEKSLKDLHKVINSNYWYTNVATIKIDVWATASLSGDDVAEVAKFISSKVQQRLTDLINLRERL